MKMPRDITKETLINTFLPFFKMYSKTETRTFFKTAKRTLRFNQLFPNETYLLTNNANVASMKIPRK